MPTRTDDLSDEEIELKLELLKRQRERGTAPRVQVTLPAEPGAAPTVTRISAKVKRTKAEIEPRWFSTVKVCPHCDKEKNVGKDFGIVVNRGVQYANSWCSQCRAETSNSYRTSPRKNRSKHNPDAPVKPKRVRAKATK